MHLPPQAIEHIHFTNDEHAIIKRIRSDRATDKRVNRTSDRPCYQRTIKFGIGADYNRTK
ncbi:MAG: hypothetical protein HC836_44755 [Richelia sp. RM2_1_2]|nr:hypothetical protein [Richelia sp. SM2_1_7]NJO64977.1 hypothetical protein [Richelia sp. RM2_1_2]